MDEEGVSNDESSSDAEDLIKREILDHIPRINIEDPNVFGTMVVSVHYSLLDYLDENNLIEVRPY